MSSKLVETLKKSPDIYQLNSKIFILKHLFIFSFALILTINITMFALIVWTETIARYIIIMINTFGANETQIVPGMTFISTAFINVFMFGGHQWCYGQQIRSSFARIQSNIANAANKWFNYVFNTMQFFLRWKSW